MAKDTHLRQTGKEVQGAIDKIIALGPATPEEAGTMSARDKSTLDDLATLDALTNIEIENILR